MSKILEKCLIRIQTLDGTILGTGFFAKPGIIVTCNHVISPVSIKYIQFIWNDKPLEIDTNITVDEKLDLAVIRCSNNDTPYLLLDMDLDYEAMYCCMGYPDNRAIGEPVTLTYEGCTQEPIYKIKFKEGLIKKGMSGSPVLNMKTNKVCGVINTTRHNDIDLGGKAIPIDHIYNSLKLSTIFKKVDSDNQKCQSKLQTYLSKLDQTQKPSHYMLFPHENKHIKDIFIEPNYLIKTYNYASFENEVRGNSFYRACKSIIKEQKVLCLFGCYGNGKTFCSKYLQYKLMEEGKQTFFIKCSNFLENNLLEEFEEAVLNYKGTEKNDVYIIFDGYEEVNVLKKEYETITEKLLNLIVKLSSYSGMYIILNSREFKNDGSDLYEIISGLIFFELGGTIASIITLEQYTTNEVNEWLKAYGNEMAKLGREDFLTSRDLKDLHKNLLETCKNPLFLYLLANHYYDKGIECTGEIYELYKYFVSNTVKGKFSFDSTKGSAAIKEIQAKYRQFLTELACAIGAKEKLKIDESIYEDKEFLDKNEFNYYISTKQFSEKLRDIMEDILKFKDINDNRLSDNALNCYFLQQTGDKLRFKDNNILFFLIAEAYYTDIYKGIDIFQDENSITNVLPAFYSHNQIMLHPMTVQFFLSRFCSPSEKNGIIVKDIIYIMIQENKLLGFSDSSLSNLIQGHINIDFLLSFLYLKINNKTSFRDIGFFFERLFYLMNINRVRGETRYYNLTRSYFRNTSILDANIEFSDLYGFNFNGAVLINSNFKLCDFSDVQLKECEMKDLVLNLCSIDNLDLSHSNGKITMKDCRINYIKVDESNISICFQNCNVKKIEAHNSKKDFKLEFVQSDINEMIIRNSTFEEILFINSEYPTIKLDGSKGKIIEENAICKSGKQKFTPVQNENIRIIIN